MSVTPHVSNIRSLISDAYYEARNTGATMETAATNAAAAVVSFIDNAPEVPEEPAIRVLVGYQMMGDMEGRQWANLVLGHALAAEAITGYNVISGDPGVFGLKYVVFTFDVPVEAISHEEAKEKFTTLANEIVGDSDAEVLWVSYAGPVHATSA